MIGNDIVDLQQAAQDSNWKRPGFLDKLFAKEEQFLIASYTSDPELMVWLLWSMKESAYKINSGLTKLRSFAPIKLICKNLIVHDGKAIGNVVIEDKLYYTETRFNKDYVHSIAAERRDELELIRVDITELYTGYHNKSPQSISHHGRYLALAYS